MSGSEARRATKAFLLAAGPGTRLQPLTNDTPKCLVPIRGAPLLRLWLDLCAGHGIGEVLINTHHLAHAVERFAREYAGPVRVRLFHEPALLGSAGTVRANRDFVSDQESFFVIYADNLSTVDLSALRAFHGGHRGLLTVAVFRAEDPRGCGIAVLDASNRITAFVEKPAEPPSPWANAGVYLARHGLFDLLPGDGFADFGFHVLPRAVGRMYAFPVAGYHRDIGTPDAYRRAQEEWPGLPALDEVRP